MSLAYRHSDPPASVAAARQAAPKAASVKARVLEIVECNPEISGIEIAALYRFHHMPREVSDHTVYKRIQQRISDLARDGLLVRVGEKQHGRLRYGVYVAIPNPAPPPPKRYAGHACPMCRCTVSVVDSRQGRFA